MSDAAIKPIARNVHLDSQWTLVATFATSELGDLAWKARLASAIARVWRGSRWTYQSKCDHRCEQQLRRARRQSGKIRKNHGSTRTAPSFAIDHQRGIEDLYGRDQCMRDIWRVYGTYQILRFHRTGPRALRETEPLLGLRLARETAVVHFEICSRKDEEVGGGLVSDALFRCGELTRCARGTRRDDAPRAPRLP